MAEEFSENNMIESKDGCLNLLKSLSREDILEVLSKGFCSNCEASLQTRVHSLFSNNKSVEISKPIGDSEGSLELSSANASSLVSSDRSMESSKKNNVWSSRQTPKSVNSGKQKIYVTNSSPSSDDKKRRFDQSGFELTLSDGLSTLSSRVDNGLSDEEKEKIRFMQIGRKKDFVHIEMIDGKTTNVLQGLELHTRVFNAEEQKKIVECVYDLQRKGKKGQLRARTYSEPRKWMRGKGRVTLQLGCCYNYAVDKNGNPPGIIRDEDVDPLSPVFKKMIKRMIRWHVLPPTCIPNSCIVNIYDEGDCIPPHIDHHDFLRPFCTVSFLTQCNILFGSSLKILNPGEFTGPVSIPLPVGSVFILNGNGADIAKHCVPGVPAKRISITFRKMDDKKLPYNYLPDPELLGIKPLVHSPLIRSLDQRSHQDNKSATQGESQINGETMKKSFYIDKEDFPPLGSLNSVNRQTALKTSLRS